MRSRTLLLGASLLSSVGSGTAAQAATVFSEDFSGATPNGSYTGAIAGTKFTVSASNVDIVGVKNGSFFSCIGNAGGNCIDLVGNAGPGAVVTSTPFALVAGTAYTLIFGDVLQGYSPGDSATSLYTAVVDGFTHTFTSTPNVTQQTFSFTPLTSVSNATLTFNVLTAPDAVHGPVLSNIVLSGTPPVIAAVPEPASWAMLITGFGMVGAGMRYRWRRTALRYA